MKRNIFAMAMVLAAAACSQPSTSNTTPVSTAADGKMGEMASTGPGQATGPIRATGVVAEIDAGAGTITLNHEAIPAISWPAMNMRFHAQDPAMLKGVAVGDRVTFELKSASETGIVTMVQKQ